LQGGLHPDRRARLPAGDRRRGNGTLGLGTKPPEPEWGLMLNTLRTAIYTQPLVAALPGLMIFMTSLSFNIFSDGLRTAMDVKQ
jgi:peptide/nickel transport system permease protein